MIGPRDPQAVIHGALDELADRQDADALFALGAAISRIADVLEKLGAREWIVRDLRDTADELGVEIMEAQFR